MKALLISLLSCLWAMTCFAQNAVLRGRVTIQNSGMQPLDNAQVESVGATAQTTDSYGMFKLTYFKGQSGISVEITVRKTGYEVVNSADLHAKISANRFDTLKIWVCKAGELDKRRITFYNINVKQITHRYEAIIHSLVLSQKLTKDTLRRLDDDKTRLLANVRELVNELTVKNLDECSKLNKRAYLLVQEGKADEAIRVLQDTLLDEDLNVANKEMANSKKLDSIAHEKMQGAKEAIEQIAESFSLKAKLFEENFDFVNAERYYRKAMLANPADSYNVTQLAKFLNVQNRLEDAIPILRQALKLTEADQNKAFIYDLMGNTYLSLNNLDSARSNMFKALNIYTDWYPTDPWIYDGHIAIELNNIGLLYSRAGAFEPSKYYLLQSLTIYKRLAKMNPLEYTANLSHTTATLGEDYLNVVKLDSAKFFLDQSLLIFNRMDLNQRLANQRSLGAIYDDLGMTYSQMGLLDTAIAYHLRALPIRQKLSADNFDGYGLDLANTLNNLGNTYNGKHRYMDAIQMFTECLDILNKISSANPNELYRFAKTKINIANSYRGLKQLDKAEGYYKQALDFFKPDEQNPIHRDEYAKVCFIVAGFYKSQTKMLEAIRLYQQALLIYETEVESNEQLDFYFYEWVVENLCDIYRLEYLRTGTENFKRTGMQVILKYHKLISARHIDVPVPLTAKLDAFEKFFASE